MQTNLVFKSPDPLVNVAHLDFNFSETVKHPYKEHYTTTIIKKEKWVSIPHTNLYYRRCHTLLYDSSSSTAVYSHLDVAVRKSYLWGGVSILHVLPDKYDSTLDTKLFGNSLYSLEKKVNKAYSIINESGIGVYDYKFNKPTNSLVCEVYMGWEL